MSQTHAQSDEAQRTKRIVVQRLEDLARSGVEYLAKVPPHAHPVSAEAVGLGVSALKLIPPAGAAISSTAALAQHQQTNAMPPRSMQRNDVAAELSVIQAEVARCTLCDELARTRTQTVFGVGNPRARLVFCGEAPGADEDRQGEPFVGRAGQLLTKIIEACTLRREDVYILNTLKCRPPGNRTPAPGEVSNCRGYLERQLDLIQPEFLCCLGTVAAQAILQTTQSIGKLRGRFHEYQGVRVLCTYHPSYLLRNPAAKRDVWEDMKVLMREMGIEIPQK